MIQLPEHTAIVFFDALVHPDTIALASRAEKVAVGKRHGAHSTAQTFINKRLVDAAHKHAIVVRLKGGDPMLFGVGASLARGATVAEIIDPLSGTVTAVHAEVDGVLYARISNRYVLPHDDPTAVRVMPPHAGADADPAEAGPGEG